MFTVLYDRIGQSSSGLKSHIFPHKGFHKLFFPTCMLWRTFRKSFIPVRCLTSWKMATSSVGVMAMERVSRTRAKRDQRRFRNPFKNTKEKPEHTQLCLFFINISRYQNTLLPPWQTAQRKCLSWWSSVQLPGFLWPRCRGLQVRRYSPAQFPKQTDRHGNKLLIYSSLQQGMVILS